METPKSAGPRPARAAPLQPGTVNLPFPPVVAAAPKRFSAFVYGFSGSGKTYMLRSLLQHEALFPALVMSCDAGHATIIDLADDHNFVVLDTPSISQVEQVVQFLVTTKHSFRTVVIDNLTELHRTALNEAATRRVTNTNRGTVYRLEQSDYGEARLQILNTVSVLALRMPNVNFIATALAYEVIDELGGLALIQPNVSGKLTTELPGFFDIVGYLYTKTPTAAERRAADQAGKTLKPVRILQTSQSSTVLQARNRGGRLGDAVIDPSWPAIYTRFVSVDS